MIDVPRRQAARLAAGPGMSPALAEALAELPELVRAHLLLSGCAVGIGVALGLPLAIVAARSRALRTPLLGLAGLVQTIPAWPCSRSSIRRC